MHQRLYVESKIDNDKTFLRKEKTANKNNICLNINESFGSIKEESNDKMNVITNSSNNSSSFYERSSDEYTKNKQIITLGDVIFEKKIQDSIKSILCPNFLTNRNVLFSKVLKNILNNKGNDKE